MKLFIISLLLLPLHGLLAAEPKVPFSSGAQIETIMSKPSRTKGGDWDDQMQEINPKIKLTNIDLSQNYEGYKGTLIVIGQSTLDRKVFIVLKRHEFEFSLMARKIHEEIVDPVVTRYDDSGVIFGYKYDGWIVLIKDPTGKIVATKASSSSFAKLPVKADKLEAGNHFDRSLDASEKPSR